MNHEQLGARVKPILVLLLCASVVFFWARVGLLPAAGGDEIWWSDSGYFLLKQHVLRWAMLDDGFGSATMSFWPPILPIVQAIFMSAFGVSPWGICAQSALHSTGMALLVATLARRLGAAHHMAIAAGIAVMAPFSIERRILQVRMECMTAVCALSFLILVDLSAKEKDLKRARLWSLCAGATAAVGALAYYPWTPYLLVGVAFVALRRTHRSMTVWMLAGATPFAAAAVFWITAAPDLFVAQMLAYTKYSAASSFGASFRELLDWQHPSTAIFAWEALAAAIVACFIVAHAGREDLRSLGFVALPLSALYFVTPGPPAVAGIALTIAWLFSRPVQGRWPLLLITGAAVSLAIVKLTVLAYTAAWQFDGRNYNNVARQLDRIPFRGHVAISQKAWLALRARIDADHLHLMVYSGASLANMPRLLARPDADREISYVVYEADKEERLRQVYPWMNRVLDSGSFERVSRVKPNFRPLPWAREGPFDLVVVSRRLGTE